MKKGNTLYQAELRQDQWDLLVMALEHIRSLTQAGDSAYAVDRLGRQFLRRCCIETVKDIQAQVPKSE